MTFEKIRIKMIFADSRKYLFYLLFSSFSIMITFVYLSVYNNLSSLRNSTEISNSISSMLIAPMLGLVIFSIISIVYAHNSFMSSRNSEFGVFLVLGISKKALRRIILLENGLIAFFAITLGLGAGTLAAPLFYGLIMKIIDVQLVAFTVSLQSYIPTVLFFLILFAGVIIKTMFVVKRYSILNMIRMKRKKELNLFHHPVWAAMGVLVSLFSMFDVIANFTTGNSIVLARSFLGCLVGVFLITSNITLCISIFMRIYRKPSLKAQVFLNDTKHTLGQSQKALFMNILLISITVFFIGISILFTAQSRQTVKEYNPFDVAYVSIFGVNNLSNDELGSILTKENQTGVTAKIKMEFITMSNLTILSDLHLNSLLKTDFHVSVGHYLSLSQIVAKDGYKHSLDSSNTVDLKFKEQNRSFVQEGSVNKVLFNNILVLQNNRNLILNNEDYDAFKQSLDPNYIGYIHLINFENWRSTGPAVERIMEALDHKNKSISQSNEDLSGFNPVSRIEQYLEIKRAGALSLFLFALTGMLFFISANIVLHLKLATEFNRELQKFKKIFKIGITKQEISGMVQKDLALMFFLPVIAGVLIAAVFSYSIPLEGEKQVTSMLYVLFVGIAYFVIQFFYYILYKKLYVRKLVSKLSPTS